jgi:hypothetical protein
MEKDAKFGTRNVRILSRSASISTVARELERYKSNLEGVQEVRWDKWGTARVGDYIFSYGIGKENHRLRTRFFVHHRIVSAVKRLEFISGRMSHIALRDCWCDIIVLKLHVPSEEKYDNSKDSF